MTSDEVRDELGDRPRHNEEDVDPDLRRADHGQREGNCWLIKRVTRCPSMRIGTTRLKLCLLLRECMRFPGLLLGPALWRLLTPCANAQLGLTHNTGWNISLNQL